MARGKKVTKEVFERVKLFLTAGANTKKIMDLEGVSEETVRRVKNADTYEDYQNANIEAHKKFVEKIIQREQMSMPMEDQGGNGGYAELIREVKETNFLLTIIVDKWMQDIVDLLKKEYFK